MPNKIIPPKYTRSALEAKAISSASGVNIEAKSLGNIITAAGMGAALELGLEIVRVFKGDTEAKELRHAVIAD